MNIKKLFEDKNYLEQKIEFFERKNQFKKIKPNKQLALSHLKKSIHNMDFYKENSNKDEFIDWLIVILYYSLYHSALSLLTNKNYVSKNHQATILILIKEYSISETEAQLIESLSINKNDAEFYTRLKQDRHKASYKTKTHFTKNQVNKCEKDVLKFINKTYFLLKS